MEVKKQIKKPTKITSKEIEQYLTKKAKSGNISALFSLFNKYFFKSFFGPFFIFVFPILSYGILGAAMGHQILFGGMLSQISMSVGLINIPGAILELKRSVLLKRIGASPIPTWKFTIVIVVYFLFVVIVAQIWMSLVALILFQDPTIFSSLGQGLEMVSFLFGLFSNWLIATCLGFAIAALAKSEIQANLIGILFFYPAIFLSGQNISIELIIRNDILNWFSKLVPFRYTTMFINSAINGISGNPFAFETIQFYSQIIPPTVENPMPVVNVYEWYESIIAYVFIPFFSITALLIAIKKFSWSSNSR